MSEEDEMRRSHNMRYFNPDWDDGIERAYRARVRADACALAAMWLGVAIVVASVILMAVYFWGAQR